MALSIGRNAGRSFAAVLALALFACSAQRGRAADPAAEGGRRLAAAERAAASGNDAEAQARAGWLRYLVGSDPAGALEQFDKALSLTEGAPPDGAAAQARALALAGRGEILDDRLDLLGASKAWAEMLRAAPGSALAELAGARLLDAEGDSQGVDEVVERAAAGLRVGTDPRGARLAREAAARAAARTDAASRAEAPTREAQAWADAGGIQRWRFAGPFAALRRIDLAKQLPLDGAAEGAAPAEGPAGPTGERALEFPDADVGLELEPAEGDIYYAASEIAPQKGGAYLAWVEGAAALELRLDGAVVLSRTPYPREPTRAQQVAVSLAPGPHQIVVRFSRSEGPRFRLVLTRADGAPADFTSAAPASLRGRRASAPCALGQACAAAPAWDDRGGLRGFAERALRNDPDDPVATWLLARATLGDDRNVARDAVERLVSLTNASGPALALHAQALLRDPEVPDRVSRAKALGELSSAADKDPQLLRARLSAASLQRDAERFDDAAAQLERAQAALTAMKAVEVPTRLLLARARLLDARGNTAGARANIETALAADATRCDARQLLFDLSRRDGALEEQVRFAEALLPCHEGRPQLARVLRERGRRDEARALAAQHAAARPAIAQRLEALAEQLWADAQPAQAVEQLRKAAALAPRTAEPRRRLSGILDGMGDAAGARAARADALRLSPGDLTLRRQVAHDQGQSLLSWADRDAVPVAKEAAASAATPDAAAVRLLDLGAVEIFPDRGAVERVHTLARVLDKKGISRFGEAHIPTDAQVLRLRTIKPDGRVLEPEAIPGKESISLPGLETGDAVEIDYLRGFAPRGPELPGLTLGAFFFRDDETPMALSSYEVRAPEDVPLEVDAHQAQVPAPERANGQLRFRHSVRDVAPLQPEPHAPAENETMPFVQIGWGASQADFIRTVADWALLRARPSATTDALAAAAGGDSPEQRLERIHAAVAQQVRGRSQGSEFGSPAAHVAAMGRGNRLVLLKAALASAGIGSHIALVRPFGADPAPYRFPRADLFGWAVLRVDLPSGPRWVDTSYRFAPLGRLPPFARGQPAWLLPEPGEEPSLVTTPADRQGEDGRILRLDLSVDALGAAEGTGRDEHHGFEAASLKDALERMDRDQRKQAVEGMLSRGLRGVSLDEVLTERETEPGGTGTLVYKLKAQLGRKEASGLAVPSSLLPSRLGRRWVQKAERALPLLVDAAERQAIEVVVQLPQGFTLRDAPRPVELQTPFGSYSWSAREVPGASGAPPRLQIREELHLPLQRVPPDRYAGFVAFARAVDQAQAQDVLVGPAQKALTPLARP